MPQLENTVSLTIVRLGEAVPVVLFSSAVDFILPVNCRRSTTAVRAASGTAGKMNSPEAEPRHAAPPAACRPACGVPHYLRAKTDLLWGALRPHTRLFHPQTPPARTPTSHMLKHNPTKAQPCSE